MPTSKDTDINEYEAITPSHVKVEIVADDDAEVDTSVIKVGIDTQDAKDIDLCTSMKDLHDYQASRYYYVYDPWWDKQTAMLDDEAALLETDFDRIEQLLDMEGRLDNHQAIIRKYGISKSHKEWMTHEFGTDLFPAIENLNGLSVGDPASTESIIALEGLGDAMKSIWTHVVDICKFTIKHIASAIDKLIYLCSSIGGQLKSMKSKLAKTEIDEKQLETHRCMLVDFYQWNRVASFLKAAAFVKSMTTFVRFIDTFTTSTGGANIIGAMGGNNISDGKNGGLTYTAGAVVGQLIYRILTYFHKDKMYDVGITLHKDAKPEVDVNYIRTELRKDIDTIHAHGWTKSALLNSANVAIDMAADSYKLPAIYDAMHKQTTEALHDANVILTNQVFSDPMAAGDMVADRIRLKFKLDGIAVLQQMSWHIAKISLTCAKLWLEVCTHVLACKKDHAHA